MIASDLTPCEFAESRDGGQSRPLPVRAQSGRIGKFGCFDSAAAPARSYGSSRRDGWCGLRGRGRDSERGASLVEFALVVPLLAMFLVGIVQFGLAYDAKQSVNSASREGARIGALKTTTVAAINARVQSAYTNAAAPGGAPTVTVSGVRVAAGTTTAFPSGNGPCASTSPVYDFVKVEVSKPYDISIPFVPLGPVTLKSVGEFKCE